MPNKYAFRRKKKIGKKKSHSISLQEKKKQTAENLYTLYFTMLLVLVEHRNPS